jgi:hypothetical protein
MFRLPKFTRKRPVPPDDPAATPSFLWEEGEMLELYRYAEKELEEGRMDVELWKQAMGESRDPKARTEWYLGARTTRLRELAEAQLRKEGVPMPRRR